jgi:hypothetical protein
VSLLLPIEDAFRMQHKKEAAGRPSTPGAPTAGAVPVRPVAPRQYADQS